MWDSVRYELSCIGQAEVAIVELRTNLEIAFNTHQSQDIYRVVVWYIGTRQPVIKFFPFGFCFTHRLHKRLDGDIVCLHRTDAVQKFTS